MKYKINSRKKINLMSIFWNVIILIFTIFSLFPIVWMFMISLKNKNQLFSTTFIFNPTIENYVSVLLYSSYLRYFLNSLIVSTAAVLVSFIAGIPIAYALARFKFKGKEGIAFDILSLKFAPEILVVIPLFIIFQRIDLYDTYFGLIWVYQLICLPLVVWVMRGYFEDIPIEIEEAAKVDGCSTIQTFFVVALPLVKTGMVAAGLLSFIFCWNAFTFPLLLAGFRLQTVTTTITRYVSANTLEYGKMAAAATISALPAIFFALLIQKHLVRGLSFGAVKGQG